MFCRFSIAVTDATIFSADIALPAARYRFTLSDAAVSATRGAMLQVFRVELQSFFTPTAFAALRYDSIQRAIALPSYFATRLSAKARARHKEALKVVSCLMFIRLYRQVFIDAISHAPAIFVILYRFTHVGVNYFHSDILV